MNLPESVDDSSLLQHEPLNTHIVLLEAVKGQSRSASNDVVSRFVETVQQDGQAAAAIKRWAYLVFMDAVSDESSLEVMDKGEALYRVFFEYQYHDRVFRTGIRAIKLKDRGADTQHSNQDREGRAEGQGNQRSSRPYKPKKGSRQVEASVQHLDAGLARFPAMEDTCSALASTGGVAMSPGLGFHSIMDNSATQQEPPFDTSSATGFWPSVLPEATKPSKRSMFKKEKKRKASSQKPPVITPSDASEDDKQPSGTHAIMAASSVSHLSKRITPNPCRQPHDLLGVNNQVDKESSVHRPKTNTQHREDASTPQPLPFSTSFQPCDFGFSPSIKGKRGIGFPLNCRKHGKNGVLGVSTQLTSAGSSSRRLQKTKLVEDLQTRVYKRSRRASLSSLSTLDSEPGEGCESTSAPWAGIAWKSTNQGPSVTDPPSTHENIHIGSSARRKRTRLEFKTGPVVSHENASADPHEFLGPDTRSPRPLPHKVYNRRLVPVANEGGTIRGVLGGAPPLEHADQLLRDVASNALAILQEGVGPDIPDWTQDQEHDAECDDLGGHDQDEANDDQATTATPASSMVVPKLPLPAPPLMWAQSRQEVCESLEYFRCYHGGVYSKGDIVKGYLLGAYAASRDIFHHGGKLIISHGGGKSESILDPRRGPKRYQTDQDQEDSDKSVRALLKTRKDRRPIALLADDKYALFPYDLTSANYTYVVLGLYWISHAWAECQSARDGSGRIVRWKFAFQWCEGQGDPWWVTQQEVKDKSTDAPKPIPNPRITEGSSHPASTSEDPSILCDNCQERSPFVYKQGWMCLNPRCNMFWSVDGEDPKQLDYREEFLDLLPQKFERLPNITPTRVVETPGGVTTTYAFSKGWHCTKCGRLSCRYKWEHWECPNCQFKHVVNGRVRSPKEFWHQRPSKGFLHSQIGKDSGIVACRLEPINLGVYKGFTNRLTFILPHDRGKIHLILGTPLSNGDADKIFQLYQQQASTAELKLRRYPLRNHRARGLLLTNYFSQNSGEPYQYVGGSGNTVPFYEAPECVRRALALIKERSSLALRTDIPFNEVLSAAYMERQKMSFHSDSEKGLGPIVASLSLGSTALMHFRPHVNMENPNNKITYALTLVLRHGDVLIMEGDGVQKYYEHTVVPMNFRIAATARCIGST